MPNSTNNNSSKKNNNTSPVSAYMTTNTFIVVIVVLFIVGAGVYFYRAYQDAIDRSKKEQERANLTNHCPDYWEIQNIGKDESGRVNSVSCKNVMRIGKVALSPGNDTFVFDDEIFNNPNTKDYARCQWAKQNSVAWTGYDTKC